MAKFSLNTKRFDPYKNFKFRVKWEGKYVAGFSKVGALNHSSELVEHKENIDLSTSRKSTVRTKYEPVTLERGITKDLEFEQWANKGLNFSSGLGMEVSMKDFYKYIIIEMYNEACQLVNIYKIYRCWVSEFNTIPHLNAITNFIEIESIKIENEDLE